MHGDAAGAAVQRGRASAPSSRRSKAVARPRLTASEEPPEWAACAPSCPRCGSRTKWRGAWCCDGCDSHVSVTELERRQQLPAEVCGSCSERAVTWSRGVGVCGACGCVLDEAAYGHLSFVPPLGVPREGVARAPIFSSYLLDKSASSHGGKGNRDRARWLDEIEILTSPHRRRRALHHKLRGGFHWHRVREHGQAERFQRARRCGFAEHMLEGVHRTTGEVATTRPFEKRCGCWRVCERCLGRRKRALREGVKARRLDALSERAWQTSERYTGREGRWGERLLTLTAPHGLSPSEDAALLRRAAAELQRRIIAHLRLDRDAHVPRRKKGEKAHLPYVRSLEVEPGGDGGHAHLHLWWFGPFIDHAWLRVTFGRILEGMGVLCPRKAWNEVFHRPPSSNHRADERWGKRQPNGKGWHGAIDARAQRWCMTRRGVHGREESSVPWPVVDVRAAREGAGEYASKVGVALYTVKGHKGRLSRLNPVHAAAVYQALEGARATQWACGWAPKKEPSEYAWGIRLMTDGERREWALAGGVPWNAAEGVGGLPRAAAVHESQAPPGAEQLVLF